MGGKAQPQMPPPVDQSVYDKTDAAEAKLAVEKEKMLGTKKKRNVRNNFNFWCR